jgi:xylitol oxidase
MAELTNWAGNLTYGAARVHRPETIDELRAVVASCEKVRALGSRHSFNTIADTPADLISLERLNRVLAIDGEARTVTVEGGARYGELCIELHRRGFALHNLASLPHISVAGACATATHGSGDGNGNLATAVSAIEIVTADGDVVALSRERDGERFLGAVVGLGGLGVVARLTLDLVPAYEIQQDVYEGLPLEQLEANYEAISSAAYSVSLFTSWGGPRVNQVWVKRLVAPGEQAGAAPELFGAALVPARRHPIAELSGENCTEQGVAGPWHERLPHFRLEFTPSRGDELQSEYFVPRRYALAAIRAVDALREGVTPLLYISELRTIAADKLWMSPCYSQDSLALHFTWRQDWPGVRELLPLLEAQLAPFGARPHWGKLFTMAPAALQARYERLDDFRELLRAFDPRGKFRNAFLDTYIFG